MEQGASSHSYDHSRKTCLESSTGISTELDENFTKYSQMIWIYKKWHCFEENWKWLLITSSQTQNIGVFYHFQKSNLYLSGNFPRRFHKTDLVLVPKLCLLISFSRSSLNKENLFWFFCGGFLKTQKMIKKSPKSLF